MALEIKKLSSFQKDYNKLPNEAKNMADKALKTLIENPGHPSLQVKKIQGTSNIWEARVDLKRRITFQWHGSVLILRRIGTHDIIAKEARYGT